MPGKQATLERGTLDSLQAKLGHQFSDQSLLRYAVTHKSHMTAAHGSYERLEFLGDRVLGVLIAEQLHLRFPKDQEGSLSRRFVDLVRKETLAEIGQSLQLSLFIRMSLAEERTGGRENPSVISDVVEALIAALYIDGGLTVARAFITKHWELYINAERRPPRDAKTALQEWAQGKGLPLPVYELVKSSGPSHAPEFEMQVMLPGLEPESAAGNSKRKAEQVAAAKLLKRHAPKIAVLSPKGSN